MTLPGHLAARRSALILALALTSVACNDTPAPREPVERPVAGGTLRVAVRDLSTLDPARATGRGALLALSQIFDSLTDVDRAGNPIPAAAASWETSSDGKVWTFKLAKASFHDGAGVTAFDFKFAFDRLVSKSLASEAAFQLEPVAGFRASRIDGTATGLSGVTVVDAGTLRITLDRPHYELPALLAHPALGPISQKVFNRDPAAFADSPVGNGAFRVGSKRTAEGIELRRFDGHAGATAFLDGVALRVAADANDGWRRYLQGEVDVAEVPAAAIESGRGKYGPEGFTPFWAAVYYGPNLRLEKFKKVEARRAISLAIDRKAIARTVYGGTKTPASGLIPRGIPGFTAERCADCAFDVERARLLFRQAYGPAPPEIVVDHLDASPSREVAGAIVANLRSAGVPAKTRAHDSAAYLQLLQSGKQELAELGWLAETPTPDGFLAQQLRGGSPNNQVAWSDGQFDSLIDRARGASEAQSRRDLYAAAEARALSQMPLVPVVFFRNHLAVPDRVNGLRVDGAGIFDAAAVWIAR